MVKKLRYKNSPSLGPDAGLQVPARRKSWFLPLLPSPPPGKMKVFYIEDSSIFPNMEELNLPNRHLHDYIRGAHTLKIRGRYSDTKRLELGG